jgi:hypothetical protein
MKKIILKTTAILLIFAGFFSCGKEKDNDEIVSLEGTAWRLAGFVDVQTGILEEIIPRKGILADVDGWLKLIDGEPIDCEECYTLTFIADSVAQGKSLYNQIRVSFFVPIQISSANISFPEKPVSGGTEIGEPPTPVRYLNVLRDLSSYICFNNELKLFYNSNKNYVLYKLISQ